MSAPEVSAQTDVLTWSQLLQSATRLLRLSARVTFQRKFLFMFGAVGLFYAFIYTIAVYEPNPGFGVEDALIIFVEMPGAIAAIYLTMDLVAKERDRQTLETLYSTASSHYMIWMVRLMSVFAVVLSTLLILSTVSYFIFAEFPFIRGAFNAFVPAAVMVAVTFYAAWWTRGANTAGMISVGIFFFVLSLTEEFENTTYWLFLNPFADPVGGTDLFWTDRIIMNRLGYLAFAAMLVFLGLRRMERRERFLN
ncbi:MAG: hypothetical protein GKS06_08060 [Acidobacteria bacterium]|nr:hypothetical protein [Acidobacteriota bacterium]